jgi:hypothetical protein
MPETRVDVLGLVDVFCGLAGPMAKKLVAAFVGVNCKTLLPASPSNVLLEFVKVIVFVQ